MGSGGLSPGGGPGGVETVAGRWDEVECRKLEIFPLNHFSFWSHFSTFLAKVPQCLISRFPLLPFSLFCCSHSPIVSTHSSASHPSSPALSHVFPSRGSTFFHPPPPLPQRAEAGGHHQPLEAHGVQQQPPPSLFSEWQLSDTLPRRGC